MFFVWMVFILKVQIKICLIYFIWSFKTLEFSSVYANVGVGMAAFPQVTLECSVSHVPADAH